MAQVLARIVLVKAIGFFRRNDLLQQRTPRLSLATALMRTMRFSIWIGASIAFVLPSYAQPANRPMVREALPAKVVYTRASGSVVVVRAKTASASIQGSGVAIENGCEDQRGPVCKPIHTWIATNAHVVGSAKVVSVSRGNLSSPGVVVYRDQDNDIALVFVKELVVPPVAIVVDPSGVPVGDTVYAIGAPMGLEQTITEGIVSAIRTERSKTVIQTSAAISSGSSGGGLFDTAARLVGITSFKFKGGEGLNFAVSAAELPRIVEATTIAAVIKHAAEVEQDSTLSDTFVTWLYTSPPSSSARPMEEFYRMANLRSSSEKADSNSLKPIAQQLVERFRAEATGSLKPPSATYAKSTESQFRLLCKFKLPDGRDLSLTFDVDGINNRVNEWPATITDEIITVRAEEGARNANVFIDRVSGSARFQGSGTRAIDGLCSKLERRAF